MVSTYPPERHLLRDLRLSFEHVDDRGSRAWMPVVPELCTADGSVRAGALATLVDVIGGGLADTPATLRKLGTVLGTPERAEALARYAEETLTLLKDRGTIAPWLTPLRPMLNDGTVKPVIAGAFGFDEAGAAQTMIVERRNVGKVVLVP